MPDMSSPDYIRARRRFRRTGLPGQRLGGLDVGDASGVKGRCRSGQDGKRSEVGDAHAERIEADPIESSGAAPGRA
jgi:hypothetical protein